MFALLQHFRRAIYSRLGWFHLVAIASASAAVVTSIEGDRAFLPHQWQPGDALTIRANRVGEPTGTYQWLHDDQPIAGAVGETLQLPFLTARDAGNYSVRFIPAGGHPKLSDTAVVNVHPLPPSPVDLTFVSNLPSHLGFATFVQASTRGAILVITTPLNAPNRYLRLNPDGAVDYSFSPPEGSHTFLALLPDNRSLTAEAPYLLNADGSLASLALPAGFVVGRALDAAMLLPDGKILLSQGARLARLNSDLTPDSTFAFPGAYPGKSYLAINALELDAAGRIYAQASAAASPEDLVSSIVFRTTPDGALDASFAVQQPAFNWQRLWVIPLADGRILRFTDAGLVVYVDLLQPDGQLDPAWTTAGLAPWPGSLRVDRVQGRIYLITSEGYVDAFKIGASSLVRDGAFYPGAGSATTLALAPDGRLLILGGFTAWDSHATSSLARLRPVDIPTAPSVEVGVTARSPDPRAGESIQLSALHVGGGTPVRYRWLALDGQPLPAEATSPRLVFESFTAANLGRYQLLAENAAGTTLSNVVDLSGRNAPPRLANFSGRAAATDGEGTLIAGGVTRSGFNALLRAVGPTLIPLGVSSAMADPFLKVFGSDGELRIENDDAAPEVNSHAASLGAYSPNSRSKDAGIETSLPAGRFTLHVAPSANTAHGVALAEIYAPFAADDRSAPPLENFSLRARTTSGDGTAIAGFVLVDPLGFSRPAKLLLRAVGPTLATKGIAAPLADPILTVYDASGHVVAQNDNWPSHLTAEVTPFDAATAAVGAFQLLPDSKDAALLLDLPAGAYTMHATGGSGIVLLEIYLVP